MQVSQQITEKLTAAFHPLFIHVSDESHLHHVAVGAQSHFKVILVSEAFADVSAVRRHQMVYQQLASELAHGVHALALLTLTAAEWQTRQGTEFISPRCQGGVK